MNSVRKCWRASSKPIGCKSRRLVMFQRLFPAFLPKRFGCITTVSISEDENTGEVRESHRRPNILPFLDDPDCWLVASIEDYDLETDTARPGPIFSERVIAPPAAPTITSAADALAVVLNERGEVDLDHIAELLHRDVAEVLADLGTSVFRDPENGAWILDRPPLMPSTRCDTEEEWRVRIDQARITFGRPT